MLPKFYNYNIQSVAKCNALCMGYLYCSDEFPVILVGNKADLENERVVSYSEGENLAAQMKVCKRELCFKVTVCSMRLLAY